MAIIVKDNFLDQKLIDTIATEIKTKIQSSEAVWATSHSWEGIVVEGSNSTNMSPLKNGVHELRQKFVNLKYNLSCGGNQWKTEFVYTE